MLVFLLSYILDINGISIADYTFLILSQNEGGQTHSTGEQASLLTFDKPYDIRGGSTLIIAL